MAEKMRRVRMDQALIFKLHVRNPEVYGDVSA